MGFRTNCPACQQDLRLFKTKVIGDGLIVPRIKLQGWIGEYYEFHPPLNPTPYGTVWLPRIACGRPQPTSRMNEFLYGHLRKPQPVWWHGLFKGPKEVKQRDRWIERMASHYRKYGTKVDKRKEFEWFRHEIAPSHLTHVRVASQQHYVRYNDGRGVVTCTQPDMSEHRSELLVANDTPMLGEHRGEQPTPIELGVHQVKIFGWLCYSIIAFVSMVSLTFIGWWVGVGMVIAAVLFHWPPKRQIKFYSAKRGKKQRKKEERDAELYYELDKPGHYKRDWLLRKVWITDEERDRATKAAMARHRQRQTKRREDLQAKTKLAAARLADYHQKHWAATAQIAALRQRKQQSLEENPGQHWRPREHVSFGRRLAFDVWLIFTFTVAIGLCAVIVLAAVFLAFP